MTADIRVGLVVQHVVFQPEDVQLECVSLSDCQRSYAKDEEVSEIDEIDL